MTCSVEKLVTLPKGLPTANAGNKKLKILKLIPRLTKCYPTSLAKDDKPGWVVDANCQKR